MSGINLIVRIHTLCCLVTMVQCSNPWIPETTTSTRFATIPASQQITDSGQRSESVKYAETTVYTQTNVRRVSGRYVNPNYKEEDTSARCKKNGCSKGRKNENKFTEIDHKYVIHFLNGTDYQTILLSAIAVLLIILIVIVLYFNLRKSSRTIYKEPLSKLPLDNLGFLKV